MHITKKCCIIFSLFLCTNIHAQYTETINSNRPGASSGAYSVGINVLQGEAGLYYINNNHELRKYGFTGLGTSYEFRYGVWKEALEINLSGDFQYGTLTDDNSGEKRSLGNFKINTIGAKYLVYDPYRNPEDVKPNVFSYNANHRFQWKTLIPSIAVYTGVNLNLTKSPYAYGSNLNFDNLTEPIISPKIMIITQNNWTGGWVFTMNFIGDRLLMTDAPIYSYILTLTHAVNEKVALFGEHQGIINDVYADALFRFGGAYLFSDNIQFDAGIMLNTKNTPSVFGVNFGCSYRLDFHKDPENKTRTEKKKSKSKSKKKSSKKNNPESPKKTTKQQKEAIDFDDE